MKKDVKKSLFAFLAVLLVTALCVALVSCGKEPAETTDSTPLGTLPTTSSSTTDTTESSSETTGETTGGGTIDPPPVGKYINPLTGIPTVKDLSGTRPLAIVVDNIRDSYKYQTGLDQADVLYEALVAPGITRFLMVVADYTEVDSVCNIRSGRDYHFDMAAYHNAVLMCHGGSKTVHYDFYAMAAERLGSRWGYVDTMFEPWFAHADKGEQYGTIDHYGERPNDLQYDTLFKPAALTALLNSSAAKFTGSMKGTPRQSLKFVPYGTEKSMAGASDATTIELEFTCQGVADLGKEVSFRYNAATDKYMRYQDGKAHVDAETGRQLSFTNVITLFTDVANVKSGIASDPDMSLVETRGSGDGYYFYGGKVISIRWQSNGQNLTLTDPLGNELTLATGNTYIGYLDSDYIYGGTTFWN